MEDSPQKATRLKVRTATSSPYITRTEDVVVKQGKKVYKKASVLYLSDPSTGEIKSRQFRVQSFKNKAGGGYDFSKPEYSWYCEDGEILKVQALLNTEMPDSGTYQLVAEGSGLSELVRQVQSGELDPKTAQQLLEVLSASEDTQKLLSESEAGRLMAAAVQLHNQRAALHAIKGTVEDAESTENDIQKQLEGQWWTFGGRFIDQAKRRSLTTLDQLDIPLIRADGSLHIVELKQANIKNLVVAHRNHLIVGDEVHKAVNQGINYLRSLDEQRATILADLGIDCRRASVTVVIGHPKFSDRSETDINETLRTYNAHLSRVEVITYKDLIEGANRSLALGS